MNYKAQCQVFANILNDFLDKRQGKSLHNNITRHHKMFPTNKVITFDLLPPHWRRQRLMRRLNDVVNVLPQKNPTKKKRLQINEIVKKKQRRIILLLSFTVYNVNSTKSCWLIHSFIHSFFVLLFYLLSSFSILIMCNTKKKSWENIAFKA